MKCLKTVTLTVLDNFDHILDNGSNNCDNSFRTTQPVYNNPRPDN